MKILIKILLTVAVIGLTACGGGGGGGGGSSTPTTSNPNPTPATPPTVVSPNTGTNAITRQAIENRLGTTGTPSELFRASCTSTNSEFGCFSDADGNRVNTVTQWDGLTYRAGWTAFNRRIEGPVTNDPSIIIQGPPRDVRQAWRDGWTGEPISGLVIDSFRAFGTVGRPTNRFDDRGTHGYTVNLAFVETAPLVNIFGLEAGLSGEGTFYRHGGLRDMDNDLVSLRPGETFDVVNLSFGGSPVDVNNMSDSELERRLVREFLNPRFQDLANTHQTPTALSNALSDAVVVKAAGNNNGADALNVLDNLVLLIDEALDDPVTGGLNERVLFVGALDGYARTSDPDNQANVRTNAQIESYSNVAGSETVMQRRFLVEYGGTPYGETAFLCDAATSPGCNNIQNLQNPHQPEGTSFAAPRVSGMAALVRHKFPNLNGGQTAKILLDTATYSGIAGNCNDANPSANCLQTYGQGRVDIQAALSPMGRLQ